MNTKPITRDQAAATRRTETSHVPRERTHFKELLLAQHFKPVTPGEGQPPAGNTTYEELVCVGYRPQLKRLDAVVHVKLSSGYSGGICTAGSQEYVEFFASTDDGATWIDLGTTSFTIWDVAGPKPLEFDVSLPVDLAATCCQDANLVLIRAILSWEVPPGGPESPVVWGNGLDAHVQVAPIALGTLQQLIECLELELKPGLGETVNLDQIVEFGGATQLTAAQLYALYEDTEIPQHRYLLSQVTELLANPVALGAAVNQSDFKLVPGLQGKVDVGALVGAVLDPQGDETYEQLGCVGLNTTTDELVATIDVKLSSGYSGDLCSTGSQEYVAFWVDWGAGYEYVGTTSVNVHDVATIPAEGLQYSAALPFAQALTRCQPCSDGPVTPQIRAVLSWGTPPSDSDPYAVPVWGGHLETNVLIAPGDPITGGGPVLESIGSMPVALIDQVTGLATGMSLVGFTAAACPFGGQINFTGHVLNPSTELFGGPGFQYRILISTNGGASFTPMTAPFDVETTTFPAVMSNTVLQTPDPVDGWCTYLEVSGAVDVVGNILGYWETSGNAQLWISMEARQGATSLGATPWTLISLDNEAPSPVTVQITSGGGSCGDFEPGDLIEGSYSAADNENLQYVSISVEMPMPGATLTATSSAKTRTTETGNWSLQTLTTTEPCGYTITATAVDNTIVNSGSIGLETQAFQGLCLRPLPA
jgi:hypothetical protein